MLCTPPMETAFQLMFQLNERLQRWQGITLKNLHQAFTNQEVVISMDSSMQKSLLMLPVTKMAKRSGNEETIKEEGNIDMSKYAVITSGMCRLFVETCGGH